MSNILITGATGFVGHALATALRQEVFHDGTRIVCLVRDRTRPSPTETVVFGDVRETDLCRRIIADYEINEVYHLAAQSIVSACAEDPMTALDVAVVGTARLLAAVREADRPIRVVVSTSDKVYGSAPAPYTEETPLDARHAYEVSKACQDLVSRMFFYNFGVDVCVVRAVNIYGPGDPNETRLVPRTVRRMLAGDPPLLHANASDMRRQYVYIDDVIDALRLVMERGSPGEAYCIGSPDAPLSVLEVMQRMADVAGCAFTPPQVRDRDTRFREITSQEVRDDKLRALGWTPRTPFAEGIRRTLNWYKKTACERKKA